MCALSCCEVVGRADERHRHEVRSQLGREGQIGDVLLRDRRKLRTGIGDVDALARGQRSRRQHPGEDLTGRHALDGQPRHAVADHDLRALGRQRGEVREVDAHAVGRVGAVGAAEDDRVAYPQRARLRLGRQPQLRPLQIEEQAERPLGALGRRAHRGSPAAQVLVRAVRAVQARAVHTRLDEPIQHAGRVGRGAERGHDLRPPPEHRASVAARGERGGVRSRNGQFPRRPVSVRGRHIVVDAYRMWDRRGRARSSPLSRRRRPPRGP